jgi:hypothetical protein
MIEPFIYEAALADFQSNVEDEIYEQFQKSLIKYSETRN